MNIGRKTARKRLRNSARETVSGGASGFTPETLLIPCPREEPLLHQRARPRRIVPADEVDLALAALVEAAVVEDQHARRVVGGEDRAEHWRAGSVAQAAHELHGIFGRQEHEVARELEIRARGDLERLRTAQRARAEQQDQGDGYRSKRRRTSPGPQSSAVYR